MPWLFQSAHLLYVEITASCMGNGARGLRAAMKWLANHFDLTIAIVPQAFPMQPFMDLLKLDATLVNVGALALGTGTRSAGTPDEAPYPPASMATCVSRSSPSMTETSTPPSRRTWRSTATQKRICFSSMAGCLPPGVSPKAAWPLTET